MENPTFFHLLTYLYIGFTKLSNNDVSLDHEMAIKRKIAQWMDLSFRNVDQYEMVMRESLQWFNSYEDDEQKTHLLIIANQIANTDNIDEIVIRKILSEIRDISVSNGIFEQSEKLLHDEIAKTMGINIRTVDDHCGPLENLSKKTEEIEEAVAIKNQTIGFRYGNSDLSEDVTPPKAKSKGNSKGKKNK